MPRAGIDPIVTATQIINGLQTIVSRQPRLTKAPVVITVGKLETQDEEYKQAKVFWKHSLIIWSVFATIQILLIDLIWFK